MFCRSILLALLFSGSVLASPDSDFLAAREAFQKGRSEHLVRYDQRLPDDYPLRPYLSYWRLSSRTGGDEQLRAFAAENPDSPLAERAWKELARFYGTKEDWPNFVTSLGMVAKSDAELRCFALRARVSAGDPGAESDAVALYRSSQDLPSACNVLFGALEANARISSEDKLARLRLALERDNLRLVREINDTLPAGVRAGADALGLMQTAPAKLLATAGPTPAAMELTLFAIGRAAKDDPEAAAQLWLERQAEFPETIWQHGWGVIGMQAARRIHPAAVNWFQLAGEQISEQQRLWKARSLIRAGRWLDVYQTILAMPEVTQEEAVWRYWKARALKALNALLPANQLFARLSQEIHYYGLLATAELPLRMENPAGDYLLTPADLQAAKDHRGLQRALLLRKLGLNGDAVAEWEWALRTFDDRQLLAAAELARQETWYDRAIITAEKTREVHNFDLRYLTPYRDLAETHARQNGLDPAWVYGLMRQESRFVEYARSSAGARGLMQIMPATAKWIARKLGLSRKAHTRVQEPETNIRFGTYYLKQILDDLHGSVVLATAGYNAGPGRARRWQGETPLEGAIYVESIPFTETRDYVKKVLANATFYSQRLGLPKSTLKDRLGTVPGRPPPLPSTRDDGSLG